MKIAAVTAVVAFSATAAADVLGLPGLANWLSNIINNLPVYFLAIVVILGGVWIGNTVRNRIVLNAGAAGMRQAEHDKRGQGQADDTDARDVDRQRRPSESDDYGSHARRLHLFTLVDDGAITPEVVPLPLQPSTRTPTRPCGRWAAWSCAPPASRC